MADFRTLCAELLDWAEVTAAHYIQLPAVMLRARAALADEPAVPEDREPVSVTGRFTFPADGEVAELVADLRQQANHGYCEFISRDDLLRAAELLQRQVLVPEVE